MGIPRTLTIAGSDSGGGAGIQADLKTFQELLTFGTSVITTVTAQNTLGVHGVYPMSAEAVEAQIRAVLADIGADAVKTGMLLNGEIVTLTAELLAHYKVRKLIVDPVMVAKGGCPLLQEEAIEALRSKLLPLAAVVTPNIPEACLLAEMERIDTIEQMERAARVILGYGPQAVLIKGGHLDSLEAVDVLYDGERFIAFRGPRLQSVHTHGTGCTLSSAIAAYLAHGKKLEAAVADAKRYVYSAILSAAGGIAGHGIGPLDHAALRRELSRMEAQIG
jgi:hydroxymethylpyrimidine/phosphomethylpyrimidine kinase